MRPIVGIFRLQLFKSSETFIQAQADHLQHYSPVYIGRTLFGKPQHTATALPEMRAGLLGGIDTARLVAFRDPSAFLPALRDRRPAIIHAHFSIDGVYAAPLSRRLDVPLITTLHGFDVTRSDSNMLKSFRPALVNGVLFRGQLQRQCALFLCVSEFIRREALKRGYPEERLKVHYIGIDTDLIRPRKGVGEDGLIVHVARLVEKKGTTFLLRAFAKVISKHDSARLVIIGDGPLRQHLEAEAVSLGLGHRVEFLGMLPHSEVLKWDARAAVKAVPSVTGADGDREGLPTVVTETCALAVPLVAFDSGGIGEVITHGESGFLTPEKDVDGLAQNLSLLLANPSLRYSMGLAARRRAETDFSIIEQTSKLEMIYDDVQRSPQEIDNV